MHLGDHHLISRGGGLEPPPYKLNGGPLIETTPVVPPWEGGGRFNDMNNVARIHIWDTAGDVQYTFVFTVGHIDQHMTSWRVLVLITINNGNIVLL